MGRAGTQRSGLVIGPADPTMPPAAQLLVATTDELNAVYQRSDRLDHPALHPSELAPPHGAYLVARLGDTPVAGGGLRRLDPGVAEIKRMYVVPEYRSRGFAAALLAAIEDQAAALGYTAVRLDTGPRQVHAQRLYEKAGYHPVPAYNDNPYACYWGEKALRPTAGGC
jgi:GNAT superfamily N-acetyltransferase